MALRLADKQAIVAEVNEAATNALSAVVSDYRGLTVDQMTEMRAKARESGVYLRVVRNTLAKRAIEGTEYECLTETLVGPTMFAFSQEDPGSAARLLKDYAKEYESSKSKRSPSADSSWARATSIVWPSCRPETRQLPCSWRSCRRRSPSWPAP